MAFIFDRSRPVRGLRAGVLCAGLLLGLVPRAASAQVGAATDIITGQVTGEGRVPLVDVLVEAFSLETQVTRRARTDARGRFTILFTDGGGQYRMTARSVGLIPRTEVLQRHADEDRLVWNVTLQQGTVTLDPITVRATPQIVRAPDGPTPGATERFLGIDQLARLPIDITDVNLLTALIPGIVPISATDSTANAFSVAGLGADANAVTLDGVLFGNASMPQEGLRNTRVVTSTYDVSRGQFSGGLIASTTRSGSNVVQGSSGYQLREDDLAVTGEDSPFAQGFTQHVLSGGVGGPIVRDRLFVYGSFQGRLRSDPQQTLLSAGSADYTRLGVHPDSVARFLGIVDGLGIPHNSVPDAQSRSNDNLSALMRLDYLLSNAHTFTLRGDWRGTSQDPARLGSLALPQTGGLMETSGGGVMGTLTSRFGATVINELRAYYQSSRSDGSPFSVLPQGRVLVASDLPDSTRGVSTLVFGGNPGLPTRARSSSIEAANELSWMPGGGRHRIKAGVSFLSDHSTNLVGANQLGVFTYNSLAALEAGQPASFRRTVEVADRLSESLRWALYAGDVWILSRPFQLTYGVRLEGSSFRNPPAYNPAVEAAFGRRTDRLPEEWHLSPRAGFTWTLGMATPERGRPPSPPTLVLRGGFGEFRSQPPVNLVAQARSATGLDLSSAEIFCIGSAVPTPDWSQYRFNPSSIPSDCAGAGPPPPGGAATPRAVTLLADGFEAPRAWRGNLNVERRLTQLFRLTADGSLSFGVAQNGFRDLNLVGTPRFVLASEGGRPVFVTPGDIAPSTGTPRFDVSRTDTTFGQVLEAHSDLRSRSAQLTVGIGGILGRGIVTNLSYTLQRTRDEARGLRGGNTATDPNVAEWARSSFERRHSVLATITYPLSAGLEITSIGRLTSGSPYTPMVGGDVNGDGSWNDRAFVFAPGAGTAEEQGISRLLGQASSGVRDCLERQTGRIAARNSCTGPSQATLDFQLNWRPRVLGLNRRLSVSVVTQNFLRGLDELFHGAAGAHGWGLAARPDDRLLYVTGFDTVAQRYAYSVNERFGATGGTATAFRPPFQVGVQMRLTIGPDRMQQAMDAVRRGGAGALAGMGGFGGPGAGPGGRGGGTGPLPGDMMARLESVLPNPAGVVLGLRDSLRLDSAQVALLTPLRDSLAARNQARLDTFRVVMEREGTNADPARLLGILRPRFEEARGDVARMVTEVRAILTEEQWTKVPPQLRTFSAGPRPGQGQQRPQRDRPPTP